MQTLIVGGGLSGLALAEMLEAQGHDYMLVEAQDRFGGRCKTEQVGSGAFDMGPAWFWPGQPRIAALIDRLELEKFEQFSDGIQMYENERGDVQRGPGYSSMEGSWRLNGGLAKLTGALAEKLPQSRKQLSTKVIKITKEEDHITATLSDDRTMSANQVVLALPPRIAATIDFFPTLPSDALLSMQNVPTWMAGQAKAVAVYDTPFWRGAGLSGDAMSRIGPMVEVHDASPAAGGPFALFGFIGVPPEVRQNEERLRQQLLTQFTRIFGQAAAQPVSLIVKDWAFDQFTSTEADKASLYAHPTYGLPTALSSLWDKTLHFAGTEVAPQFGGFLEGALEAAEIVLGDL